MKTTGLTTQNVKCTYKTVGADALSQQEMLRKKKKNPKRH